MDLMKQIGRFLIVGGLAFVIDYGVLWLLAEILGANYLIATTISFLTSVVFNYILSSIWVFRGNGCCEQSPSAGNFIVFSVLSGIGLLINLAVMWFWVDVFYGNYMVAKFFSTGIVMIYNFISRKIFMVRKSLASSAISEQGGIAP